MSEKMYSILKEIINKLRTQHQPKLIEPMLSTVQGFEDSIPAHVAILPQKSVEDLARFIFVRMEDLLAWQILDLEHSKVREKLNKLYGFLMEQDLTNWNRMFTKDVDLLGVQDFRRYLTMLQGSNDTRLTGMHYLEVWVPSFVEKLNSFHAMGRMGFTLPGFTIDMLVRLWVPEFRKLYDPLYHAAMQDDQLAKNCYLKLCTAVTHLIYALSDFSLFKLEKEFYMPEYNFLKNALHMTKTMRENDINGEILDCLMLLGAQGDSTLKKYVEESQFFLVASQSDDGSWKIRNVPDVHAIHTAVCGLLDHSYAKVVVHRPFELPTQQQYISRLQEDGLMQTKYDFFKHNPAQELRIRGLVDKTIREYGLADMLLTGSSYPRPYQHHSNTKDEL
jgi:hypothetical protein